MRTLIINSNFKKITIAYDIKHRLKRSHIKSELNAALSMATDYSDYCYILRLQDRLVDVPDTIIGNTIFWSQLK
jgi:hypothetical protein